MNNNSISVTVKFFATLRQYGPEKEILTIPKDSTVKLLFNKYNIPKNERQNLNIFFLFLFFYF